MARSLSDIIESKQIGMGVIALLQHPLVELLAKHRDKHPDCNISLSAHAIEIDGTNSITLTPQAFVEGTPFDERQLIADYGNMMQQVLANSRQRGLSRIASQCSQGKVETLGDLYTLLERRAGNFIYIPLIALILGLLALLWQLNSMAN